MCDLWMPLEAANCPKSITIGSSICELVVASELAKWYVPTVGLPWLLGSADPYGLTRLRAGHHRSHLDWSNHMKSPCFAPIVDLLSCCFDQIPVRLLLQIQLWLIISPPDPYNLIFSWLMASYSNTNVLCILDCRFLCSRILGVILVLWLFCVCTQTIYMTDDVLI